eukprot:g46016.t1
MREERSRCWGSPELGGHSLRIKGKPFSTELRKNFFTQSCEPVEFKKAVGASSLHIFKRELEVALEAKGIKEYGERLKQAQDEEMKQLTQIRDSLRSVLQVDHKEDGLNRKNSGYSIHPLPGNRLYGTEKSGFLNKKSDGIRRVWQKRKCGVKYGYLTISHSTINRPPAILKLLTCQVKPNLEEKRCFDLIT